ncbi:MAG: carboxymuconolactone decarboxylase family protein [Candidatus Aminicenantes bacterium]|nr:carboxymuconolactone decarboxylase family protein [Candidatus Aminicenantes bacterium]
MRHFPYGKKKNPLGSAFVERLMLAVSQVNNCALCSYMHAAEALKAGLSAKEIRDILSGSIENVPRQECVAVLFAQHYAESKGCPEKASWIRLVETYGRERTLSILAVIRTIMFGNVFGIPLGSLLNRIRGKKGQGFSLLYELGMLMLAVPFFLIGLPHAVFGLLFRSDPIRFAP